MPFGLCIALKLIIHCPTERHFDRVDRRCFASLFCFANLMCLASGAYLPSCPQTSGICPKTSKFFTFCSQILQSTKPKYVSEPCSPKDMVLCCVSLIKAMKKEVFEYPMPSISAAAVAAAPMYHPLPSIAAESYCPLPSPIASCAAVVTNSAETAEI